MTWYTLTNEKDTEEFTREFVDATQARHWIINHLDLSKNWHLLRIKTKQEAK